MRIATFNSKPVVDEARHADFLAWMSSQPGLRAQYDPVTGHHLSVSIWESHELMLAMRDRVPPGGPHGRKPDAVTFYDVDDAR